MKKEIKIGIYAIVIIAASWAGIRFLSGADIFGRTRTYTAYYDSADGLKKSAAVMIRGVRVGQVVALEVDPENPSRVAVKMNVPNKYDIPADSKAVMHSAGIMSGKVVEIELGVSPQFLESGDRIESENQRDLLSTAGSQVEEVKQKLFALVDNLNRTLEAVRIMVESNTAALTGTINHVNSITGKLDRSDLVESLGQFSKALSDNAQHLSSVMENLDGMTTALKEREMAEHLAQAIENINALLEGMRRGEGSAGQLLQDKKLYESLNQSAENLAQLLADLKENPKKYINVTVFPKKDPVERLKAKIMKDSIEREMKMRKKMRKGK